MPSTDFKEGDTVGLKIESDDIEIIRFVESELSATEPKEDEE